MCTVTIFPEGLNGFVLTSNRDEDPNRTAITPDFYSINDVEMLLPKDEISGGSWIGASAKNRVLCLLNGGFLVHEKQSEYKHSRGVVLRDLLAVDNIVESVEIYDFKAIEPFTLVIVDWNFGLQFYELVWDGFKKHFTKLLLEPKIWSSSTLYSEEKKHVRTDWFNRFKDENILKPDSLLKFHKMAGTGNTDFGVIMDRGHVKTTSITQIVKNNAFVSMRFENLLTAEVAIKTFNLLEGVNG